MNQDCLTNFTLLKHRNNASILKLCWDAWAFSTITTTNITAIATTTTTTTRGGIKEYAGPRTDHDRADPQYRYLDWYATANTDYV